MHLYEAHQVSDRWTFSIFKHLVLGRASTSKMHWYKSPNSNIWKSMQESVRLTEPASYCLQEVTICFQPQFQNFQCPAIKQRDIHTSQQWQPTKRPLLVTIISSYRLYIQCIVLNQRARRGINNLVCWKLSAFFSLKNNAKRTQFILKEAKRMPCQQQTRCAVSIETEADIIKRREAFCGWFS